MTFQIEKPADVAALVAVATVITRVLWGLSAFIWRCIAESYHAPAKSCSIDLGPFERVPSGALLKCLLVRYGTDKYIQSLASAQDKFEGRLRNQLCKVELTGQAGGKYTFTANIPVHQRLGTQFKFFFEVNSENDADILRAHNVFEKADIAKNNGPVKVWILLKDFDATETVEGWQNNFWPAV